MVYWDKTYLAASTDDPAMQNWLPYSLPSDNELLYFDRYLVISRCRDLENNNPLAKAIIDVLLSHVIGGGLIPEIGDERIEKEFKEWCENTRFGCYRSFYQMQELVLRTVLVAGDVLINLVIEDGLKVQLIEPERVTNPNQGLNTVTMRNGVEIDDLGEPIRYHILSTHPAEPTGYINFVLEVSKENPLCWLVFKPRRPDQHRGIPLFSAVLSKFKMLDAYLNSELLASVIASNFSVFVESPTADFSLGSESENTNSGESLTQSKLRPGMIVKLSPGEKVQIANPSRPNPQLEQFVISIMKLICAGVGMSHEVVTQSFSANYSASKAAMSQSWKTVLYWRRLIVDNFCNPVFRVWCEMNGYENIKAEWHGTSRVILDDAKEVSAAMERVTLGISSRKEECEDLRGRDWELTNSYLQREQELGYGLIQGNPDLDQE